ncbi:cyanate hydratase [Escherichia coli]|uniref:Cyanate hydratase n=1 Tax=Escherichia coli TaxID=562 RepID=A0A447XAM2_ECOLX|nr:cyanate hydratase [Escherichia coli]
MIQSQINRNIRLDLADAILLSKAKKDLSFAEIADGTGLAEAFVTAALLGSAGASCRCRPPGRSEAGSRRRRYSTVADDSTAWLH